MCQVYSHLYQCQIWYYQPAMSTPLTSWTGGPTSSLSLTVGPTPAESGADDWHLLSIKEVANACRLSEKAIRRAIDEGELPAVKLRSRLRIAPHDFEAWIASGRRSRAEAPPLARPRAPRRPPTGTFRAMVQRGDEQGFEL
jgi:excisionase family DNA binding protein